MENNAADTDITLEHSTNVEKEIQDKINYFYQDPANIEMRLKELDEEWEIERFLEIEGAALTILGVILGLSVNKKFFAISLATSFIMLAGAIKGWSRPVPLLRKLGFRTRAEIDKEKYALKAVRGDFKYMLDVPNVVWNAVNK